MSSMSSQQKRGFRLPWAVERAEDEDGADAATLADAQAQATTDTTGDEVGGDLGEGPFHFADAPAPDASTDAPPEASEVPRTTEAAMIETESPAHGTDSPELEHPAVGAAASEASAIEAVAPKPAAKAGTVAAAGDARATRSNPLVAGLVKAMREAAQASREETTTQLRAESTARVETIREAGTTQAAELRKRADEDIAGIRDWSKQEVARVRAETDERIEARKSELAKQVERHEASVERRIEAVQSTIGDYETAMDRFFERLLSENDPARLAALAEQAPEPPDLSADLLAFGEDDELDAAATGAETAANAWDDVTWDGGDPRAVASAVEDDAPALEADAAAEAEAAATEGLDLSAAESWPASVLASARRTASAAHGPDAAGAADARILVNGLTSVAGISSFKGALAQLPGIRSVSVSSGEPGVFVFSVVHTPDTNLQEALAGMTAFSTTVTEVSGDTLTVVAHEPVA
jgi:hypothetical protein